MKTEGTQRCWNSLVKKNKARESHTFLFNTFCKSTVTQCSSFTKIHKCRSTEWNYAPRNQAWHLWIIDFILFFFYNSARHFREMNRCVEEKDAVPWSCVTHRMNSLRSTDVRVRTSIHFYEWIKFLKKDAKSINNTYINWPPSKLKTFTLKDTTTKVKEQVIEKYTFKQYIW